MVSKGNYFGKKKAIKTNEKNVMDKFKVSR
jgi:hypothetical protein